MVSDWESDAYRVSLGQQCIRRLTQWGIALDVQRELLGLSQDEWSRVQRFAPLPLEFFVLESAEALLAVEYAADFVRGLQAEGLAFWNQYRGRYAD